MSTRERDDRRNRATAYGRKFGDFAWRLRVPANAASDSAPTCDRRAPSERD